MIIVRDYSAVRPMITPESLPLLRTFWYVPEEYTLGPVETAVIEGFSATTLTFVADQPPTMGRAMLLLTPDSAYLFVGIAGQSQWQTGEFALFEAIVATLRYNG